MNKLDENEVKQLINTVLRSKTAQNTSLSDSLASPLAVL